MKNILFLLVLSLFPNLKDKELTTIDHGLVAHYSFNECDATDDTGNGSDGKLFGKISCKCGIDDDGLYFNGASDYVEFYGNVNKYFGTSDFTISFYFKPVKYSVFQQSLISKREACDEFNMLDIQLNRHAKTLGVAIYEAPHKYFKDLDPEMQQSGWQQLTLVREGTRATTYLNGQLQKTEKRCSGIDITNDAFLSFSKSPCIDVQRVAPFRGVLDELRVYNRALSESEVMELYALFPVESAEEDCIS